MGGMAGGEHADRSLHCDEASMCRLLIILLAGGWSSGSACLTHPTVIIWSTIIGAMLIRGGESCFYIFARFLIIIGSIIIFLSLFIFVYFFYTHQLLYLYYIVFSNKSDQKINWTVDLFNQSNLPLI